MLERIAKGSRWVCHPLFLLFALSFLGQSVLYLVLFGGTAPHARFGLHPIELMLLSSGLSFLLPLPLLPQGRAVLSLLKLPKVSLSRATRLLLLSLLSLALAFGIGSLEEQLLQSYELGIYDRSADLVGQAIGQGISKWHLLPYTILLPALAEELFFRGTLQTTLEQMQPQRPRFVWLLTALTFSLIHMSLVGFVARLVLGYTLSYLRSESGSLLPPIALHMTNNLLALALL